MISLPENVKDEYKDYNREIKVFGNLYLAKKRFSKNLFNINGQINVKQNDGSITNKNAVQGNVLIAGTNGWHDYGSGQQFTNLNGKTFTITAKCISYGTGTGGVFTIGDNYNQVAYKHLNLNETGSITYTATSDNIIISFATDNGENAQYTDIQLEISDEASDYEEYGVMVNDYNVINTTSNNLFNINGNVNVQGNSGNIVELNSVSNNILTCNVNGDQLHAVGQKFTNLNGKTITFSAKIVSFGTGNRAGIFVYDNGILTSARIDGSVVNDYIYVTYTATSNNIVAAFATGGGTGAQYTDIQINIGNTILPYERYNSSPFKLNEENECKILSFNINENADVYYTSLPYNTMAIEVDNEKGYFTDYDEDSIVEKLNNECYIDLFMQINNGTYYKIMTMNFDKISYSDYQKAKLEFYTNFARIKEYDLKDKNNEFANGLDFWKDVKQYVLNNYNINLNSDHPYITDGSDRFIISHDYKNLNGLILSTATTSLGSNYGAEVLLTSDYNNNIMLKAISNIVNETIDSNLQLEKPIIKREDTYLGAYYNWHTQDNYVLTDETYTYSIRGTLNSKRDTLIIVDDYYRLRDITINEITASSNINVSVVQIASYYKNMLSLVITGNIGDNYDITINKANMYKNEPTDLVKWPLGQTNDTSKILEIEDEAPLESSPFVFLFIKKPILSRIEAKIMGLPYLEIGDTISVVQDNKNVRMFITEIKTSYLDGLIQTIKGYELDWTHQVSTTQYSGAYSDLNDWE